MGVVGFQRHVAEEVCGLGGGFEIGEAKAVALGNEGCRGRVREVLIVDECIGCIGLGYGSTACGLDFAAIAGLGCSAGDGALFEGCSRICGHCRYDRGSDSGSVRVGHNGACGSCWGCFSGWIGGSLDRSVFERISLQKDQHRSYQSRSLEELD